MPFAVQVVAFDAEGKRRRGQRRADPDPAPATTAVRARAVGRRRRRLGLPAQGRSASRPCARRSASPPAARPRSSGWCWPSRANTWSRCRASDGRGGRGVASDLVYVIGKGEAFWSGDEGERMTLIASKPRYRPGRDRAPGAADAAAGQALALVTLERDGILSYRLQPMATSGEAIEIPIEPPLAPNVFASVVLVRGRSGEGDRGRPRFKMGMVNLEVDASERRLQVSVDDRTARRTARASRCGRACRCRQRRDAGAGRAGGGRGRRGRAADPGLPHARSAARVLRAVRPGGGAAPPPGTACCGPAIRRTATTRTARRGATAAATRRAGCARASWPPRSGPGAGDRRRRHRPGQLPGARQPDRLPGDGGGRRRGRSLRLGRGALHHQQAAAGGAGAAAVPQPGRPGAGGGDPAQQRGGGGQGRGRPCRRAGVELAGAGQPAAVDLPARSHRQAVFAVRATRPGEAAFTFRASGGGQTRRRGGGAPRGAGGGPQQRAGGRGRHQRAHRGARCRRRRARWPTGAAWRWSLDRTGLGAGERGVQLPDRLPLRLPGADHVEGGADGGAGAS